MPRSCFNMSDTAAFGIPRPASSSRTVSCQSLLIAARTCSTFPGALLVAGLPEHGSISKDSQPSLKGLCHTFICAALIVLSPKALWIIQIVSLEGCSSLTQNLMQIHCSAHSVTLNVTATQYSCSLNGVYCPHWPYSVVSTSGSCRRSRMHIPVHSPWLPGYTDVTQTIFIILTMTGTFLDRPCIITYVNSNWKI